MIRTAAIVSCLLLTSCANSRGEMRDRATQVFTEVWSTGDVARVDALFAPDVVDDSVGGGKGRAFYREAILGWRRAFPDLKMNVVDVLADGDRVAVRWTATGTQEGPLDGIPPTGRAGQLRGLTIFRFERGLIKEEWTAFDRLDLLRQLGAR
jgi:steroid delta-isomerase-like uncharacterized protein